ncbi:hypothetical protein [Liquorilactobacillus sicerae]|uniref:hypothetical protein n=1 Tax=Liquorilactobacillus sicerae TaxID=1416943 RepID=UPI0024802095|nr:hypothetical protein [Liquorilactobacillus sicerae]
MMMNKNIRVIVALVIVAFVLSVHYIVAPSAYDIYFDYGAVILALMIMPRPKLAFWRERR